jgi:hypothetical protein
LGFRRIGGLVLVEELATVGFVVCLVFGIEDGGAGGQAVTESVKRRTLFAGFGARAGGFLGVELVDGGSVDGNGSRGLHMDLLDDGITRRWVEFWDGIVEVVDREG